MAPVETVAQTLQRRKIAAEEQHERAQAEKARLAADFQPPAIDIGADVCWYEGADPGRRPLLAKVMEARGKALTLVLYGVANFKTNVRHLEDPALENVNHRENGAWDYTPWDVAQKEERKVIKDMLEGQAKLVQTLHEQVEVLRAKDTYTNKWDSVVADVAKLKEKIEDLETRPATKKN